MAIGKGNNISKSVKYHKRYENQITYVEQKMQLQKK